MSGVDDLSYIRDILKDNFDVKYRVIKKKEGNITLIFIDNLCDSKFISEYIVTPLIETDQNIKDVEILKGKVLHSNIVDNINNKEIALMHILSGDVVLIFDFINDMLFCEAKGYVKRAITIPQSEAVLKGPKEGFSETIVDNVSLIRRRIKNADLKFQNVVVGKNSNTTVVIAYIKNIAPESLIGHIKSILENTKEQFILDANYIQEMLEEKYTAFDTIGESEKPDVIASKLLEGRVVVIVDGSPMVLSVPFFFIENFKAPDDYYSNRVFSNCSIILRLIAYVLATMLLGLYLALTTYHFSLIPGVFVFRLSVSRAGVPFPTVVEVLLMFAFFQLIREAGIRLPQPIGQAMSIVGALILGDAAVGAGLTSQSTVFIVALTSISYFLIPKLYGSTVIWSLIILLFAAFLGLPGFYIGVFMLLTHVSSLKSCGYSYLFPLGTYKKYKLKDILLRDKLQNISKNVMDKDEKK